MKINELHALFLKCSGGVVIDTRKMIKDCLFVALKGVNFDANTFANTALLQGAKYVIVDNSNFVIDHRTILVENCLSTLQELAKFHRKYLNTKIIALTGSNGKTTTKELIFSVLSKKYKTLATQGNLNNHIGVPLTLLRLKSDHEIAVVEMGANHQKEIDFLCQIATPDFGYITNFGKAHLEGFGGVEGVIKGKSEMYDFLKKEGKSIFICSDNDKQMERAEGGKLITFSMKNQLNSHYFFTDIKADPFVSLNFNHNIYQSNLTGSYNATNVMAAIVIGMCFYVDENQIQNAIAEYIPENNRSQIVNQNNNKILLDAYNANPSSMIVAIEHFISFYNDSKILILGDMYELGEDTKKEHQFIVDYLSNQSNATCFFVGNYFYQCQSENKNFHFFQSLMEIKNYLKGITLSHKNILIKGSRAMSLEKLLEVI